MTPTFGHSGDAGDAVAALSVIKAMGGGSMVFFDREKGARESMKGNRFQAIRPLIEAQPYIRECVWSDSPEGVTHDFSTFRHDHKSGEDLASWQARHLGVTIDLAPWIMAYRNPESFGRVVVARSFRYQNREFPWRRVVSKYGKKILFVGLQDEHKAFQIENSCLVEWRPTKDLLELAEIIAGCELFIGNQSCPFWIAAALGVNLVQESHRPILNSIIKRSNARYLIHPPYDL